MGRGALRSMLADHTAQPGSVAARGAGAVARGAGALAALAVAMLCAGQGAGCNSSPTDANRPDGGPVCQTGSPTCAAGTTCVNRNCVPNCAGGAACGAGFYCEAPASAIAICSLTSPIACATNFDCPLPQVCSSGLCTSLEVRADGGLQGCVLSATGNDACAPDGFCFATTSSTGTPVNQCIGLPHCGVAGLCPVGLFGSTCNQQSDGGLLFASKERLCLFSYCLNPEDCPARAACFRTVPTAQLGSCNYGQAGDPCFTINDCINSRTCLYSDGGVDDGGVLGTCSN